MRRMIWNGSLVLTAVAVVGSLQPLLGASDEG